MGYHGIPQQRNVDNRDGKAFWRGEQIYHLTLPWIEILGRYLDTIVTMFRLLPIY